MFFGGETMPKIFEIEHILYLTISILLLTATGIILKKKIKDEKSIKIMFRILGLFGLIFILSSRITLSIDKNNILLLFPDSFCSMTSYLVAIGLLFLNKDNFLLHITWLLAIVGNICSLLIPDYLADGPTIFYPTTITALMHHSFTLFEMIMVFIFKYITLTMKKAWTQLLLILFYIGSGLFLVYVLKAPDAYYINNPAVVNTPLNVWLMIPIYISIYFAIIMIIELLKKHKSLNINE